MKKLFFLFSLFYLTTIQSQNDSTEIKNPSLVILGTVQDAGSPHPACNKVCCVDLFAHPDHDRMVVSLGIIDPWDKSTFLFEATPDMPRQMKLLKNFAPFDTQEFPNGIFLTHAHIGHYTGLMYLGREASNSKNVPVFVMPRMKKFLENNGPWSQLVKLKNIVLYELEDGRSMNQSDNIKVTPFLVPHRDEFSETVGYKIEGPQKTAVFIPDIDKWQKWDVSVVRYLSQVDYAFVDATFFDGKELANRDMSEIPHPFVVESMDLFKELPIEEKAKVHFIHLNHTNPLLNKESLEYQMVIDAGFNIAKIYQVFEL